MSSSRPAFGTRRSVLGTLWLLSLIAAAASCLLVYNTFMAYRQRRAVHELRQLGGYVRYDYQVDEAFHPRWGSRWELDGRERQSVLRRWLGEDFCCRAVAVVLRGEHVTDDDLGLLQGLPHLGLLDLNNTGIGSGGLVHLRHVPRLRMLFLSNSRVSDEGLRALAGLPELQVLYLDGSQITDAGLEHLTGLSGLQYLNLANTAVSDAAVGRLQQLSQLSGLSIVRTRVSRLGAMRLQQALPRTKIEYR